MTAIPYKVEKIPDESVLYYHIGINLFAPDYNFDDIPPHAFTPIGETLSLNWEKYCPSAQDCLDIPTPRYPKGRTSKTHGVGHFIAKDIRAITYEVIHSPSRTNRAHAHIEKLPPRKPRPPYNQMRKKLKRIFKFWDIRPENGDNDIMEKEEFILV